MDEAIAARLASLDYFRERALPAWNAFQVYDPSDPADLAALGADHGFTVEGLIAGNRIVVSREANFDRRPRHAIFQGSGNTAIFGPSSGFHGRVVCYEAGGLAFVDGHQHSANLDVTLYTNDLFLWGEGSVSYGTRVWVCNGKRCTVDADCLFAEGTVIRTSDHHSVLDLDTGEMLNGAADIEIGRHVWLGQDVMITKGTVVGSGSIIGARSLVNRAVPQAELWAGSPARSIRARVSWTSSHPPSVAEAETIMRQFPPETSADIPAALAQRSFSAGRHWIPWSRNRRTRKR